VVVADGGVALWLQAITLLVSLISSYVATKHLTIENLDVKYIIKEII
jgi:hypothetical protein